MHRTPPGLLTALQQDEELKSHPFVRGKNIIGFVLQCDLRYILTWKVMEALTKLLWA